MSSTVNIFDLERFRNCVLFSISLRKWNNRAQVRDMLALQKYIQELDAAKREQEGEAEKPTGNGTSQTVILASDRVKSSKVLIRSKAYEELCQELNGIKDWCLARSMPSYFRAGMFVVKQDVVGVIEKALRDASEKLVAPDGKLSAFINAYPQDIDNARTTPVAKGGLGPIFRLADYPTPDQMREAFSVEWYWLALSVPENLPEELKAEAGDKFKRRLTEAAQDIENALRVEFQELLARAEERLTVAPGEKPKVFKSSLVGNLIQFIETFEARDVFGDQRLASVIAQAKATLLDDKGNAKFDAAKLREYASVREVAREQFGAMKKAMDDMIQEQPKRKFDFSED